MSTSQRPDSALDLESEKLSQEELDEKPWKYIGYKDFVKFVSSDDDFFALRRFDRLHSRVMLAQQARISALEEELDLLDAKLSMRTSDDVDNGSIRDDDPERIALLGAISDLLEKYDGLLCKYLHLKAAPGPQKSTVQHMKRWLSNRNHPIDPKEVSFLNQRDIISVSLTQKSPLRAAVEQKILIPIMRFIWGRPGQDPSLPAHKTTTYLSDHQMNIFSTISVFAAAITMLIAPLWILTQADATEQKLGIITSFLVVFICVLNWGTLARPFEIFAATAGYSAVLVVFLQLDSAPKQAETPL